MTMPHLMNCAHSESGWCLACVGELAAKADADREEIRNFQARLDTVRVATSQGCLAAALGKPMHAVAQSGHKPRTLAGDAWEAGHQYVAESAEHRQYVDLLVDLAAAREEAEKLKVDCERLTADVKRFSELADSRHDMLSAERRRNDQLCEETTKARELASIVIGSLEWNGDGYEWTGGEWDYRMQPAEAAEATQRLIMNLREQVQELAKGKPLARN